MNQSRRMRRRLAVKVRQKDPRTLSTAAKWQAALTRADDVAYMQLLETENTRLETENQVLKDQIRPRLIELPELHLQRVVNLDLERKLDALEAVRCDIEQLPEDLPGVIQLVEQLYPDRILFCAAAIKSAKAARINEVSSGIGLAWRLLRAMALVLYDLYMEGSADISRQFHARSGFELAMGEGPATKQNAELMQRRVIEHDGSFLDIGAHAKCGNREPKLLRVHYGFCTRCARVIVGHCGDHLVTAGTRKLT